MKVWVVTASNCEGYSMDSGSIHANYESAVKAWNILRLEIQAEYQRQLAWEKSSGGTSGMYEKMIENLKETDPQKIGNGAHGTPEILPFDLIGATA